WRYRAQAGQDGRCRPRPAWTPEPSRIPLPPLPRSARRHGDEPASQQVRRHTQDSEVDIRHVATLPDLQLGPFDPLVERAQGGSAVDLEIHPALAGATERLHKRVFEVPAEDQCHLVFGVSFRPLDLLDGQARTQLRENLAEPLLEIPTLNLFGRLRVDLVEGGVALVELVELVGPGWEENPFTKHLNLRTVLHRVARRRVAGVLDVDVL